jgi:hypothetical protein
MNKKILTLLTVAFINVMSFADTPKDNEANLVAQFSVTEGRIKALLAEMNSAKSEDMLISSEYLHDMEIFKRKVEDVLTQFDHDFKEQVMPPLKTLGKKYKTVADSKNITTEQKELIFKQLDASSKAIIESQEKIYQSLLQKVLIVLPGFLTRPNVENTMEKDIDIYDHSKNYATAYVSKTPNSKEKVSFKINFNAGKDCTIELKTADSKNYEFHKDCEYEILSRREESLFSYYLQYYLSKQYITQMIINYANSRFYRENLYFEIKGTCKTQTCIALKSGEYIKFIDLFNKQLNLPLEIEFIPSSNYYAYNYNGKKIKLNSLNSSTESLKINFSRIDYPEQLPVME